MPDLLRQEELSRRSSVAVDERLARLQLRRQIGRLERELAGLFAEAFGHAEVPHRVEALAAAAAGPRPR